MLKKTDNNLQLILPKWHCVWSVSKFVITKLQEFIFFMKITKKWLELITYKVENTFH